MSGTTGPDAPQPFPRQQGEPSASPGDVDMRRARARQAGNWTRAVPKRRAYKVLLGVVLFTAMVLTFPLAPLWIGGLLLYSVLRSRKAMDVATLQQHAARFAALGPRGEQLRTPRLDETAYVTPGATLTVRYAVLLTGMWVCHGRSLAVREDDMAHLALRHGGASVPCPPAANGPAINPAVTVVGGAPAWQVRNVVALPDPEGDIQVQAADMNSLDVFGGTTEEATISLNPATVVEAWYPSSHVLVVVERDRAASLPWEGDASEIGTGEPAFDRVYATFSDDEAWARLLLNPAVMQVLLDLAGTPAQDSVSLLVNNGRVSLVIVGTWIEPAGIEALSATLRRVVQAARSAEEH